MVESDIMLVVISNVIVTVVFYEKLNSVVPMPDIISYI